MSFKPCVQVKCRVLDHGWPSGIDPLAIDVEWISPWMTGPGGLVGSVWLRSRGKRGASEVVFTIEGWSGSVIGNREHVVVAGQREESGDLARIARGEKVPGRRIASDTFSFS